jgi:peptidoglycan/xylan/chitin deacetylase (PgdA/CDA1 family)
MRPIARLALATAAAAGTAFHAGPALAGRRPIRRRLGALTGRGRPGTVALTFDDGPDPRVTPAVLDALGSLGWPGTFFMVGERVLQHPGVARQVVAGGHEVGVHGHTHRRLLRTGPVATLHELASTVDAIASVCDVRPRWFRPTYGKLSGSSLVVAAGLRLRPVLWTSVSGDWRAGCNAQTITESVMASIGSGGTVLFHDAVQPLVGDQTMAVAEALHLLAEEFRRAGLEVVALSRHLSS